MSNKKVLLLAVIFGLLTALTLNFYLQQVKDAATRRQTKKIVVAVAAIPAKSIITKEMVALQDVPLEYAHASAVTDVNQAVGSIARAEIVSGEQILKEKLLPQKSSIGGLSNLIPLGMRAVSIPVSDVTGVSGLVMPGDRVDLIGTIELENANIQVSGNVRADGQVNMQANAEKTTVSHLLMQNVEVLAVGKNLQPTPTTENDEKKAEGLSATITLAVPPEKMQVVAMILEKGKVSVALRSPADRAIHSRPLFRDMELLK
jgi:pilus assembly protein CpaB